MYVREFSFQSTPDKRPAIEALADTMFKFTKTLNGFISAHYLVSEDEKRYLSFTMWFTKDDAESAGEILGEKLGNALDDIAIAPPEILVSEVYHPKA